MLSRVETMEQLYSLGDPPDNKFYANQEALEELGRLDKVSVNRNKPTWERDHELSHKIALFFYVIKCLFVGLTLNSFFL